MQNAGVTDPTLAPPGHSTLYVLVPVPNLHAERRLGGEAPRYRDLVLDRLAKLGIERPRAPHPLRADGHAARLAGRVREIHHGATFNLAHDLGQMLHFRPAQPLRGRWTASTWSAAAPIPGSGLPVIFEGARITTRLLLARISGCAPVRGGDGGSRRTCAPA